MIRQSLLKPLLCRTSYLISNPIKMLLHVGLLALLCFCDVQAMIFEKLEHRKTVDTLDYINVRTPTPVYVPLYIYKHTSITNVRQRVSVENLVYEAQQTYSWYNIKLIVKEVVEDYPMNINKHHSINDTFEFFRNGTANHINQDGLHLLLTGGDEFKKYEIRNSVRGLASIARNCKNDARNLFGVVRVFNTSSLLRNANVLQHEIGHMLSLSHDSQSPRDTSTTRRKQYIMFSGTDTYNAVSKVLSGRFSGHSERKLIEHVKNCNFNVIYDDKLNKKGYDQCGNGIVDFGEECDCGSKANCILSNETNCCDMKTCKLKAEAQCSHGVCCDNCKFTDKVCRKATTECEEDATCSTGKPFCPKNNFKIDGTECSEGYCVGGKCPKAARQCRKQFDKCAIPSPSCAAYSEGEIKHHCSDPLKQSYEPAFCKNNGITMCNLLFCDLSKCRMQHGYGLQFYDDDRKLCGIHKYGYLKGKHYEIPNGFPCAQGKMCLNKECVITSLNVKRCEKIRCQPGMFCNNGVCYSEDFDDLSCRSVECDANQVCKKGKCVLTWQTEFRFYYNKYFSQKTPLVPDLGNKTKSHEFKKNQNVPNGSEKPSVSYIRYVGLGVALCLYVCASILISMVLWLKKR